MLPLDRRAAPRWFHYAFCSVTMLAVDEIANYYTATDEAYDATYDTLLNYNKIYFYSC